MNTKQMDCAIMLARTLNFRKAAEKLFISQPALTYQIQTLERELGFEIFQREPRGISLSPAGADFMERLVPIRNELQLAIENGRNFAGRYEDSLTISVPLRSALYFLPEIIRSFQKEYPKTKVNVVYIYDDSRYGHFLSGKADMIFGLKDTMKGLEHVRLLPLFDSHVYLVCSKEDPLAGKMRIEPEDLEGRVLMIGGGSPDGLRRSQNALLSRVPLETFNSPDHMSTLTYIAAGCGVALIPGFCNDHSGEFEWIPVSFDTPMPCVLAFHESDIRKTLQRFLEITADYCRMAAIQF